MFSKKQMKQNENFLRCSFSDNLKKQTCLSINKTVDLKIKMLFKFLLKNADTCVSKVVSFNLHYHQSICMLGKLTLEILISSKSSTTYNDAYQTVIVHPLRRYIIVS